jgi:hypothetical protein
VTSVAGIAARICVADTKVVVRSVPFQKTFEIPLTKLVPFTVNVNAGPVTGPDTGLMVVMVGALIVNVETFEVASPPLVGVTTVTSAVSGAATSAAGMLAVSLMADTKVVVRSAPFQYTLEVLAKFEPLTVSTNVALPVGFEVGLKLLIAGAVIVYVAASDVPPFGRLATVTLAVPSNDTSVAGIAARICVADTKVVVRSTPFQ